MDNKKLLGMNTYQAAVERTAEVFKFFSRVYLSFSGGKDSTVMLHIAAEEARKQGKRFGVLIVDLEAQYKLTIDHINTTVDEYKDCIDLYWVALPIALRNAVSVYEPKWECWSPDAKAIWVRQPDEKSITDLNYFPFFRRGMEFEDFVPKFGDWYSQGQPTACLVGIRTVESLNRWRTIANTKKKTFGGRQWTTQLHGTQVYNCYPIYDMSTQDIWVFHAKFKDKRHNELYDLMHKAGLSIHKQRICQPYGDDQRQGLWLYQAIEPETWAKIVARVSGANSGAQFVQFNGNSSGRLTISKPDGHTWQSFAELLLETMPPKTQEHYKNKIFLFIRWWEERGYSDGIPDVEDRRLENSKKAPSWRRVCKMILRNDYWGSELSFGQTKDGYFFKKYKERITKEREERKRKNHENYGRIL